MLVVAAGDDDAYFHLTRAERHLRNAECKLYLESIEIAKRVRKLREEILELLEAIGED